MSLRGYSYKLVEAIRAANPELIGVQLGLACINVNIPVSDVAKAFKVSRMTIYSWFIGASNPQPQKVKLIKHFLAKKK